MVSGGGSMMRERVQQSDRGGDGISRRNLLRVGSLAALGLSVPELLRSKARAATSGSRDVSCILLWLQGGISQIDSFDPKPEAPREIRGEFATIATNVPGISLAETLPALARHQDKFSILRSLNPRNGSHGMSDASMLTGHKFNPSRTYPAYGSVIAREKGARNRMPPYVQLGTSIDGPLGGGSAGDLGDQYNPLVLPGEVADSFSRKAFDLQSEAPKLRERYGRHSLGRRCLLARRLIESGVRFVTVTDGGWDTHTNNFTALKNRLLPRLDSALSALLQDLSDRGMLDSTLVVTLSDFGRTPKINASAGRDHCDTVGIALLAGGGLVGGRAIGRTNALGEHAIEAPYEIEDSAATIYHTLGIPHDIPNGRLIRELF